MTPEKVTAARNLLEDPEANVSAVAAPLGVSRATLYRHMATTDQEQTHRPSRGKTQRQDGE